MTGLALLFKFGNEKVNTKLLFKTSKIVKNMISSK